MNGENGTMNGENGTMNDTIKSEIELTEFECNLIALLKENGAYTRKMLAEAMNCAERTVSRAIDQLKENHVIYRVGSRRDGYWAVVDFSNRSRPASSAKETKATDDSSDTTKSDDF
ncbi:MAG: HTH domain-containing protein [Bacteroidales bacterium]|nr:HTH domain-containing protein [Bacteroidales bacterium]